jgi:hypothetical protein
MAHPTLGSYFPRISWHAFFWALAWAWWTQFRGLRAHPILRRVTSSCEDTLSTLFTRPLWPPSMNRSSEFCCVWNSYTANAGEHLEGNWIPLGQRTCHEGRASWSCLAFSSTESINNKTFWVILSHSVSSFILLFPLWKLQATETGTII